MNEQNISAAWVDWLARVGYGIDYSHNVDPPCTLTDLAKAWRRANPDDDMTDEDWAWCITENTGAFANMAPALTAHYTVREDGTIWDNLRDVEVSRGE